MRLRRRSSPCPSGATGCACGAGGPVPGGGRAAWRQSGTTVKELFGGLFLGRSGLEVPKVAFGTWQLGGDWGAFDEDTAIAAIHHARDLGVNFFDAGKIRHVGVSNYTSRRGSPPPTSCWRRMAWPRSTGSPPMPSRWPGPLPEASPRAKTPCRPGAAGRPRRARRRARRTPGPAPGSCC
ncbi:aldo/keto reductase [Amycolatopsis sp. cg9]|uniref:aldo/keto reductase n=1 Tax=Amycolatopsis sp. cg9 TaxID=3238801 RepID=UPI0035247ACF